ncbi:MAG: trigger factor [Actinomycetota bacterium]
MQTNLENVDRHTVRLSVEVSPEEARPVLDLAYRHLASSVTVPGFRKGKVPRKIIDSQLGRGAVLQEFLEHALPEFYGRALREHDLAPIADPQFDDLEVEEVESSGLRFTATVEVRPRVSFEESDYKGLKVRRPSAAVSEAEIDEQLDRLRERFAELEVVGRPARRGDFMLADIRAYVHGEEIPEASGQDLLYEIGSEALVPELDAELEGKRSGDILKLNAKLPERFGERAGEEISLQVLVKEAKAKRLADLDDEFARTASEFDTLEELRGDVRTKVGQLKEVQADAAVRDLALQAVVDSVDVDLPERLLDAETERRVQGARDRAERSGTTLEEVLQASDVDELRFRSDARSHATRAVRADLALEAVARAEGLTVTSEELDRAVDAIAGDVGRSPKEVRRTLEETGQITSLAGDIIRDKALGVIVEHAEIIEEDASPQAEGKE